MQLDLVAEATADHRYHFPAGRAERIGIEATLTTFRAGIYDSQRADSVEVNECAADRRSVIVAATPRLLDQHRPGFLNMDAVARSVRCDVVKNGVFDRPVRVPRIDPYSRFVVQEKAVIDPDVVELPT